MLYMYFCLCLCESCPRVGGASDEAVVSSIATSSGTEKGQDFDPSYVPSPPPPSPAALPPGYSVQEAERTLQLINELIASMTVWARACPINF